MEVSIDNRDIGQSLEHHWNFCVGAGRANEALRASWQEALNSAVRHCGFRYVRFHGLFHDDMFVYKEKDGTPCFNFQYIDDVFDRMLDQGVRPFVELGFSPGALAREKGTVFWWKAHGSPPVDMKKWNALVKGFVEHCIERYGQDEVRQWYFEVWNEPNLPPFFAGTKSEYFELYKNTAKTVKSVDKSLPVGGPATSNFVADERFDAEEEDEACHITWQVDDLDQLDWKGVWIKEFLEFCASEKVPLDFISTHPYPTDFALDEHGTVRGRSRGINSTYQDLTWLRECVNNSAFPDLEIHLTEWNSSPSARDMSHDYVQGATFIVKTNLDSVGLVDSLSYWTFTDVFEEGGAGDSIFHGGFGLINYQGIVKPAFHAYRFLGALGDEVLQRGDGWIITRDTTAGCLQGLVCHYPSEYQQAIPLCSAKEEAEEVLNTGTSKPLEIEITNLPPEASFKLEILDEKHGFPLRAWKEMGCPEPPNREQTALLQQAGWHLQREVVQADTQGTLYIAKELSPWSVMFLTQMVNMPAG